MIRSIMNRYLPEKPHGYYTGRTSDPERAVRWSFGVITPKSCSSTVSEGYLLTIKVRHGAFGEAEKIKEQQWYSLTQIAESDVVNVLFAALTFDGTPYWFDGKKWRKRVEVM